MVVKLSVATYGVVELVVLSGLGASILKVHAHPSTFSTLNTDEYNGLKVPDVLLSGDHKKIDEYRQNERIRITKEKRPDLLKSGE